jgi:hypothetical protein
MLEHGKLVSEGSPGKVIEEYLKLTTLPENTFLEQKRLNEFWGKEILLNSITPLYSAGLSFFHFGEDLLFEIGFSVKYKLNQNLRFGCTISTLDEKPVLSMITSHLLDASSHGQQMHKLRIKNLKLFPGSYRLSISIGLGGFQESRKEYDVVRDALVFSVENLTDSGNAVYNWIPGYGNVLHEDVCLEVV